MFSKTFIRSLTSFCKFSTQTSRLSQDILVLNCGSSSIKFQIVDPASKLVSLRGLVERLSSSSSSPRLIFRVNDGREKFEETLASKLSVGDALSVVVSVAKNHRFIGVGHRVVHGGLFFEEIPQVAVFDTAFYRSLPAKSFRYAVPEAWFEQFKIRRYGFHGISHSYVVQEASRILQSREIAVVSAHIGNGCSVSATVDGVCVDTSMGFSPLEGLVMGQRSGDVDPAIVPYLSKKLNCDPAFVVDQLNKQSGLLGLTGKSDFRDVLQAMASGSEERAKLGFDIFAYRLAKYIASYQVPLGRIDALVFTAGVGENSALLRKRVLELLSPIGFRLDERRNEAHGKFSGHVITRASSAPVAMVIPANEEIVIAAETLKVIQAL